MTKYGPFILLAILSISAFLFFATSYTLIPAGDIAEYFGVTQSLLSHSSINLDTGDIQVLSATLHSNYFTNPGYYITGINGGRYPVHFFAYSILLIPLRVTLDLFHAPILRTFPLTNLVLFTATILFTMKRFFVTTKRRYLFLILILLSPLLSFVSWPGPDILVICLLFLGLCFAFTKKYGVAGIFIAFASWHSQPLAPLALFLSIAPFIRIWITHWSIGRLTKAIPVVLLVMGIISIPYIYNYVVFGVLTPWTIFQDNWTVQYGFGMQNISIKKLFEQFFDPNIGILWYMPMGTIIGIGFLLWKGKQEKIYWLAGILAIITALLFQTNPAWHYGTSGYGPTRHILFIIPLFLILTLRWFASLTRTPKLLYSYLTLYILIQSIPLTWNGWLTPQFAHTLYHSPAAAFFLQTVPSWYEPTPELFVDRTNHTDLDHLTSAIYTVNGVCKKAYIQNDDITPMLETCGYIDKKDALLLQKNPMRSAYITYK